MLLLDLELLHLFHESDLQVLVPDSSLCLGLLLDHHPHSLSLVIILDREVDLLLLTHVNQSLTVTLFCHELGSHFLLMQVEFLLLLVLELLNQLECSAFIVPHVLVPCL